MGLCNARESHASHPECVLIPNEGAGKIHLSMSAQRFYYLLEMCLPLLKCSTASRVEMLPTGPGYAPWPHCSRRLCRVLCCPLKAQSMHSTEQPRHSISNCSHIHISNRRPPSFLLLSLSPLLCGAAGGSLTLHKSSWLLDPAANLLYVGYTFRYNAPLLKFGNEFMLCKIQWNI